VVVQTSLVPSREHTLQTVRFRVNNPATIKLTHYPNRRRYTHAGVRRIECKPDMPRARRSSRPKCRCPCSQPSSDRLNRLRGNIWANRGRGQPLQSTAPNRRHRPSKPRQRAHIDLWPAASMLWAALRSDPRAQALPLIRTDTGDCRRPCKADPILARRFPKGESAGRVSR
jgi:hypothetical protein